MLGRLMICSLAALTAVGRAPAEEGQSLSKGAIAFAEGKKLLDQGKDARAAFVRALQAFQQQEGSGAATTAKAQNVGNAAYLADDLPRAILAYRYGLSIDRHHAVMRGNLTYARSQVRYPPAGPNGRPEPEIWPRWLPRLRATWLVGISAISYFAAWMVIARFFFRQDRRLAAASVVCLTLAVGAAYGCHVLRSQRTHDIDLPPVVIVNDDVPLRTGNGVSYPRHAELPTLFRGMEARQLNLRGSWRQIQFHSGEIGWIPARDGLAMSELWQ